MTDEDGLPDKIQAAVIGAGPAGLMAAERLARSGFQVHVFDSMPSTARKFLRAGVGGLNLTHTEGFDEFCARYSQPAAVRSWLQQFTPVQLRDWAAAMGIDTFVGTSGRIFPVQKKASPLLRAWLRVLDGLGVRVHTGHRWLGWTDSDRGLRALRIETQSGVRVVDAQVCVLALGGASWRRLGSDGSWASLLQAEGVSCAPFQATNCGFNYAWSDHIRTQFAGTALKAVRLCLEDATDEFSRLGEGMIGRHGIEGGLVYHASSLIREHISRNGEATLYWDLVPDRSQEAVEAALSRPRGKDSMSNYLRKRLGITGIKLALLYELAPGSVREPQLIARVIKRLPQIVRSPRPLDEAISTAGGIRLTELTPALMLAKLPGVFCAGEMLDWEAPTGGYLLNASLASGVVAGEGAATRLREIGTG